MRRHVSERITTNHNTLFERMTPQAWPDQIYVDEDGVEIAVPATQEYYLGNPNSVVAPHREFTIDTIFSNDATIIRSPTGTGKTTEISMFLLEHLLAHPELGVEKVYFTQPRIVAASATTDYERQRLCDRGMTRDRATTLIGCHTATIHDYDAEQSKLINVTDGVTVQQFINGDIDPSTTLLVIDEVHEDKENMHLLLLAAKRHGIRVVVMSATVDVEEKAQFLANENGEPAPIIDIKGETYPVERKVFTTSEPDNVTGAIVEKRYYRKDYEAVSDYGRQGKDMMIFVGDISEVARMTERMRRYLPPGYTVVGLHGEQTPEEQAAALRDYPNGKLIVSTNIGMTSLTPNVDVVLDPGMSRVPCLNNGVEGLTFVPASLAETLQRLGRCGRTKEGIYERVQVDGYPTPKDMNELEAYSEPEVRTKLPTELILKLVAMGYESTESMMTAPLSHEVERGVRMLHHLGAVALQGYASESLGELTEIGEKMVGLPVDAFSARMLVESQSYPPAVQLQLAAAMAVRRVNGIQSPSMTPTQLARHTKESDNDLLVGLDLFIEAIKMDARERQLLGVSEKRFSNAMSAYEDIVRRQFTGTDLEMNDDLAYELTVPTELERAQLHACMLSGINEVYRARNKGKMTGGRSKHLRKMTGHSRIHPENGELIAGRPFDVSNVSRSRGGTDELGMPRMSTSRLVTDGMRVDVPSLRQFAPERIEDRVSDELRVGDSGELEERVKIYFDNKFIGVDYWQPVGAETQTKEFLINHMFTEGAVENVRFPESIVRMREQLRELRDLQQRTRVPIDIDAAVARMKELVAEAAADEEDIADMREVSFDTSTVISDDVRAEILKTAPDVVKLYDVITGESMDVAVEYHDTVAYITLDKEHHRMLAGDIPGLVGHEVMVRTGGGSRYVTQAEAYLHRNENRHDLRGTTTVSNEEMIRRRLAQKTDAQTAQFRLKQAKQQQSHQPVSNRHRSTR